MKKNKVYLITGISGAGKTVFVKALEDAGFYCVDNLPVPLLSDFLDILQDRRSSQNIAVVIDIREKDFLRDAEKTLERIAGHGRKVDFRIIFLDARNETLIQRYSETRRKHPIDQHDLLRSIEEERMHLKFLRDKADYIIDTSKFTVYDLRRKAYEIAVGKLIRQRMSIKIMSFGYKYGIPGDADIMLDMRFLPNPFYEQTLKDKTGMDAEVVQFLEANTVLLRFLNHSVQLMDMMIKNFEKEGKNFVTIAFGCTGGRHRSVYTAAAVADRLKAKTKHCDIVVSHRDLGR